MRQADQADADEVLRLQKELGRRHQELTELDDDDQARQAAARSQVFAATNALLNFEVRLPGRRDARRRKVSSVIVYAVGGLAALVMLLEVGLMSAGRVSWWYLLAVVPVAALAGVMVAVERNEPVEGHRSRAAAAVLTLIAAALIAVVTFHILPAAALVLLVVLLVAAVLSWLAGGPDASTEETA